MIFPNVDSHIWRLKHGLPPDHYMYFCRFCSSLLEEPIPFATKDYRGLAWPTCEHCGVGGNCMSIVGNQKAKVPFISKDTWKWIEANLRSRP